MRKYKVFSVALVAAMALAMAACSSNTSNASSTTTTAASSGTSGGTGSTGTSSAKTGTTSGIKFKTGKPTLSGMSFTIDNAAGSAHIGDTNVHDLVTVLTSWGASASQTNASHNAVELAVASGKGTVAVGPLPTEVDTGLHTFGPNLTHLTDGLLAKPTIKTLKTLKGKTVAYCCTASPDGVLLTAVLKKAGLKQTQIHLLGTGASTASLNALIAGKVTAAFTAMGGLPAAASKFHMLTDATQLLPKYADSFMSATPTWLKKTKTKAIAVNLAWLSAAKLFNNTETQWVKNAAAYTQTADTTSQYQAAWKQLKTLTGWPVTTSAYTPTVVKYNLQVATQQQALKGTGTKPATTLATFTAWKTAWTIWQKHQGNL